MKQQGRPRKEIIKTDTPPVNGKYYTIAEVVNLTGLHRHTIQARCRDGSIKAKLIGNTWRIYPSELYEDPSN